MNESALLLTWRPMIAERDKSAWDKKEVAVGWKSFFTTFRTFQYFEQFSSDCCWFPTVVPGCKSFSTTHMFCYVLVTRRVRNLGGRPLPVYWPGLVNFSHKIVPRAFFPFINGNSRIICKTFQPFFTLKTFYQTMSSAVNGTTFVVKWCNLWRHKLVCTFAHTI